MPVRLWRVQPWNPNPLMRASDRWESLIWLIAVLAALLAVPIAGAAGTASYTGAAARIAVEDSHKTLVTATVTGVPEAASGVRLERYPATVRWDHEGRTGTADVDLAKPATTGTTTPIWINDSGKPTAPPARTGTAAAEGVGTGLAILVETWCAAAVLVWVTHSLLNARRNARWDREWRSMNNKIGRDTL